MFNFKAVYDRNNFVSFLSKDFLPEDFNSKEENLNFDFASKYATSAVRLGKCPSLDLEVFEIAHKSTHDARVGISRDAFQLLLRKSYCNRALVAFVPEGSKNYRFSLLQIEAEQKDKSARITRSYSNPRRYSYFLGEDAHTKTPEQFLIDKGRIKPKDGDYFKDLLERFSVEVLTKQFYNELSNWYFWAIKNVSFPNDINDDSDDERYNTENVIRLITRLIFTWFLKKKKLINPDLFDPAALSDILTHFKPESEKQTNYYRAVLQNLFFATLNQEIGKRGFAEDRGFLENKSTNGIKNMYRFEKEFSGDTTQIMQLFSQVPFLNGGLFECLDGKEKEDKTFFWDGFSRNPKRQANIPNSLFFAKEQIVDISKEYNNKKMQAVKVSGIIEILNRYNFTVEENTPVEIEVALDPELLGKVFENLLGAFNPETQETARKQTGSFYTPREIVSYMVNESLIAYFKTSVPELSEDTIRSLFSYEEQKIEIAESEREAMIQAAFNCKILDPACGSGAFPMGILQQMVHVLSKLDPCNNHWNKVVLTQAMKEFDNAEKQTNEEREELRSEIESTFDRSVNYPDYARKLHLIENCIYGVDIQSIAVQISKLRFFISLICEQKRNEDPTENFGIRPLPNLETKFVAANTLIGIEKAEQDMELFEDDHIKKLIDKLQHIRHRQFLVTNATQKKTLREKDELLRHEIVNEVQRLYVKHADENLSKYKMQKKVAEKELEQLIAAPDDIRTSVSSDLFGTEKAETFNYSEKRRKELKANIKLLNEKIEIGSDYSRLNSVVRLAEQLTSWNPYDQNESSPFFDPEWMFGLSKENGHIKETGYFDIVIGNPPYVQLQKDKGKLADLFKNAGYQTFERTGDIYTLFYEFGFNLLNFGGILTLITSSQWMKAGYGMSLRKLVLSKNPIKLAILGPDVFDSATVDTNILIAKNEQKKNELSGIIVVNSEELKNLDKLPIYPMPYVDIDKWAILDNTKQAINNRINHKGKPLKEWDIKINFGIKTGYNKAFIIDEDLKNELVNKDPKSREIINPVLRGREIDKYYTEWDGGYIISTFPTHKINIENYDSVKKYLESFLPKLNQTGEKFINALGEEETTRKLTVNKWFETQDPIGYYKEFSKEKIIWKRIGSQLRFSYSDKEICCLDSTCICTGEKIKYLTALLNSKLCNYQLFENAPKTGMGDLIISVQALEPLMIYYPTNNEQKIIEKLFDKILDDKLKNQDTTLIESQIDNFVYKIYELTYDEVKVIDSEFRLSEKEYNDLCLN